MAKQKKTVKPQSEPAQEAPQPKTKTNKTWLCDLSVTGYGYVLKDSPVLPEQLAAFKKFNPEGDLSQYQK